MDCRGDCGCVKDDGGNPAKSAKVVDGNDAGLVVSGVVDGVKEYYGKVLETSANLRTSACTTCSIPPEIKTALKKVPKEVVEKYYGCGSPFPCALAGLTVLDLGSGSGRDCYVLSQLVGEQGHVIGVDMTQEQVAVARAHADQYCTEALGYSKCNMTYYQGYIEDLQGCGVKPDSVDVIISNCVVNLSPDKAAVMKGAYAVLKDGGEFYFSDVYCDRRMPTAVRKDPILFGECLGGALYEHDFVQLCKSVGFIDPREVSRSEIKVTDPELSALVGNTRFFSITYRLFKLPQLEPYCEDYGQVAIYKGTIEGNPFVYALDNGHTFEKGRPVLVCGNSTHMIQDTRLSFAFDIIGNKNVHYGAFDCSSTSSSKTTVSSSCDSSDSSDSPKSSGCGDGCC
eukprot:m.12705 g.12705  ORF g.12705 m.12705 type:complete len:397 (+) comp7303_c0_seq1:147-1337(+)